MLTQGDALADTVNRRTICIFSALYLPNVGGIEVFTYNLARALSNHGDRVIVVTSNIQNLPPHEMTQEGFEVFRLPCHPLLNGRFPLPKRNSEYRSLLKEISANEIDGIVINTRFYPHSIEALRLARAKGCRALIIDHGADYLTFGNPVIDVFVKAYEHLITAKTRRFRPDYYGVSESSLKWLRTFGVEGKGIIGNAIDVEAFIGGSSNKSFRAEYSIGDEEVLVVFVGRLIPEKGIGVILDAAERIEDESPCRFLVAGDGPLRSKLEKSGLSNLHCVGRLDSADVAALLQDSDVFCFPSRSEGFGGSLLEAAVCENALISTDVGIATELIPSEEYGIRFGHMPTGNELAAAISSLCEYAGARQEMAERCARRARELFSWDNTVNQVHAAFAQNDKGDDTRL